MSSKHVISWNKLLSLSVFVESVNLRKEQWATLSMESKEVSWAAKIIQSIKRNANLKKEQEASLSMESKEASLSS